MPRPSSSNRNRQARVPREHGFWVLLAITIGAALLRAASWNAALVALLMTASVIGAAAIVGKRVRKNPPLQALGSLGVAFSSLPILLVSGVPHLDSLFFSLTLGVAYLSGTFCVRAVLCRAKKEELKERAAAWLSVLLPLAAAIGAFSLSQRGSTLALLLVTLYTFSVAVIAPSARKLRPIGLTISVLHVAAAVMILL